MLVYGLLSTEPIPVDDGRMIFNTSTIRGFWLSEWLRTASAERRRAGTTELLRLMAAHKIVPPIEAEYPLNLRP